MGSWEGNLCRRHRSNIKVHRSLIISGIQLKIWNQSVFFLFLLIVIVFIKDAGVDTIAIPTQHLIRFLEGDQISMQVIKSPLMETFAALREERKCFALGSATHNTNLNTNTNTVELIG